MAFQTILAADDSIDILETLATLFGSLGYRVVFARNGQSILALIRAFRPDLVITDVTLRAGSGIEFLRDLRRDGELGRTPVILWSAVYPPDEVKGLARGCEPFTARSKFDDPEGLVSAAKGLLGSDKLALGKANSPLRDDV
jgi:CheY-like chemotaxis protein